MFSQALEVNLFILHKFVNVNRQIKKCKKKIQIGTKKYLAQMN